jgi:SWI/SNF-related matrix-associated actin-dependent regulator 1 of chromatin subfamily A
VSYADHDPTRCAFDDKALGPDDNGICPGCWKLIQKPLTVIKASRGEVREALAEAPEALRADLDEQGDLTKPEPAFNAMVVGLLHVAMAVEFGDRAIDTVANRVDEGKLVVATVYNLAAVLGYKDIAARLLRFRLGDPKDLIRFRDTGKGVFQVHTPYDEKWNGIARENRQIFFTAPEKDAGFWWRTFHSSELRRVANMLQGVYGDQLTLGLNGKLFALPSMPLPKEEDFGKAPTGKPKATGEKIDIPPEIEGIRIGERIKLPGGGESIVQFIDPRKRTVGVGDTKDSRYVFYSFDIVETENGRPVAARINAERKKAAAAVGGGLVEDLVIDRVIPAGMKNYQIESVAFIEKHRRVILGDEQGLGKSVVALTCLDTPAIIVCPATLKYNWIDQMAKWRPELTPLVLSVSGGEPPSVDERKRASVFVINYDIVKKHLEWLTKIGAKTLIADEAQYLKNLGVMWDSRLKTYVPTEKSPQRANAFYELHRDIPKIILATGTPVMNRTKELFPLLHLCNRQEWNNQTEFQKRYCGAVEKDTPRGRVWDANGRTNSDELHKRIKERYLIRHTKATVLTELPPKMRTSILVQLSEKWRRAYLQLTRDFLAWVYAHGGPEKVAKASRAEALTRLTAMRRISANGKVEAALEWIQSHLESTGFRPLIVMGVHADAFVAIGKGLDAINAQFDADQAASEMPSISRKIRWNSVVGSDGLKKRVTVTTEFQERGTLDVLLFSIPLATGLTLTRSQDMLFLERLWRPADQVQAEDRIHRLGQKGSTQITYLDGMGTIDQKLGLMLMDKTDTAAEVIDGETLTHDQSFFRVFGDMIGKDGKKMDPSKLHAVESLADLIDEAELEAIDMAQSLDELVKARKAMEAQKIELRDFKMKTEGMTFEEATTEAEALNEDIEEFAKKLREKRGVKPNRFESFEAGELYPGHAEDHAYYEEMRRKHPDFDDVLDDMVVDSWNQPPGA